MSSLWDDTWLIKDEGPPLKIPPKFSGTVDDITLNKLVSSIKSEDDMTIYTFSSSKVLFNLPRVKPIQEQKPTQSVIRARRKSAIGNYSKAPIDPQTSIQIKFENFDLKTTVEEHNSSLGALARANRPSVSLQLSPAVSPSTTANNLDGLYNSSRPRLPSDHNIGSYIAKSASSYSPFRAWEPVNALRRVRSNSSPATDLPMKMPSIPNSSGFDLLPSPEMFSQEATTTDLNSLWSDTSRSSTTTVDPKKMSFVKQESRLVELPEELGTPKMLSTHLRNKSVLGEESSRRPSRDEMIAGRMTAVSSISSGEYSVGFPDEYLNLQDVIKWHETHRLPKRVRTMRFSIGKGTSTNLDPATMFLDLHKAFITLRQTHDLEYTRSLNLYLFNCVFKTSPLESVEFEAEICKVMMLKIYALRIKRISGDRFVYRQIHDDIIAKLDWK